MSIWPAIRGIQYSVQRGDRVIKIIGSIFIIFSSSGIGYILGKDFSRRVEQLKLLRMSLQMLETEIEYSSTPLPYAFESISKKCISPVREIFKDVSDNLKGNHFSTVGEAFEKALIDCREITCFKKEDMEILKSFSHSIGSSDREGQEKSFRLVIKQLEGQEDRAEESRAKNEKMYKSLGLLAGLAIAIILL